MSCRVGVVFYVGVVVFGGGRGVILVVLMLSI